MRGQRNPIAIVSKCARARQTGVRYVQVVERKKRGAYPSAIDVSGTYSHDTQEARRAVGYATTGWNRSCGSSHLLASCTGCSGGFGSGSP
jgi:hypothetical protein